MTPRLLLAVVLGTLFSAPTLAQDQPAAPTVRSAGLVFDETAHDFGTIFDDEPQAHSFTFRNEGDGVLIIRDVRPSCKCTVGELTKRSYAPGENGSIEVGFNPTNKSGPQRQTVRISSNDPENPALELTITVTVKERVVVTPKYLDFGKVDRGESKSVPIRIAGRGEGFTIHDIVASREVFTAEVVGDRLIDYQGDKLREYEILVTVSDQLPVGMTQATLDIGTSDERRAEVSLNLVARVTGMLTTSPPRVLLRNLREDEMFSTQMTVSHTEHRAFTVQKAELDGVSGGELKVGVTPIDESTYRVTVAGVPEEGERFVRGEIVVSTDVPGEEKIRIKFYGTIRRK